MENIKSAIIMVPINKESERHVTIVITIRHGVGSVSFEREAIFPVAINLGDRIPIKPLNKEASVNYIYSMGGKIKVFVEIPPFIKNKDMDHFFWIEKMRNLFSETNWTEIKTIY